MLSAGSAKPAMTERPKLHLRHINKASALVLGFIHVHLTVTRQREQASKASSQRDRRKLSTFAWLMLLPSICMWLDFQIFHEIVIFNELSVAMSPRTALQHAANSTTKGTTKHERNTQ